MSHLCRLCLSERFETTDLSEYREGLPISVLAMIILPVKIYDGEDFNLPQKICSRCLETIVSAYKLRDVSLNSEKVLRSRRDRSEITVKSEIQEHGMIFIESTSYEPESPSPKKRDKIKLETKSNFYEEEEFDEYFSDKNLGTSFPTTSEEVLEGKKVHLYKKKNSSKSSLVWRYFGRLHDKEGKHIGIGYHYCSICISQKMITKYKETTGTSSLIIHLESNHGITKDDPETETSFVTEKFLRRKERINFTAATVCSECGKTFKSNKNLREHMKIHAGEIHSCDICPAKYSHRQNLYRHKLCHDPNHGSRYVCDMCGKGFAEIKSLRGHMRRVHDSA